MPKRKAKEWESILQKEGSHGDLAPQAAGLTLFWECSQLISVQLEHSQLRQLSNLRRKGRYVVLLQNLGKKPKERPVNIYTRKDFTANNDRLGGTKSM